jgi:hypothetical protein
MSLSCCWRKSDELANEDALKGREAHQCESPDLNVSTSLEELGQREWLGSRITTISIHTIDDEEGFALSQELPGLVSFVGKVDNSPVADNTEKACQSPFDDEDPWTISICST